jgi:GT2 family glycosyltransferase
MMKQLYGYTEEDRIRFGLFHEEIKNELEITAQYKPVMKDILIVVCDQLPYVEECIKTVQTNTEDYKLYLWDNGSKNETSEYLESVDGVLVKTEENYGFILPNNRLADLGESPYIILLNSDTFVRPGWDKSLVSHLETGYSQVGYLGGFLDETGRGEGSGFGGDVDYIPGWCFGISRDTYNEFGLFDEKNLEFAYCEDADFSLRLTEAGRSIYALHLGLVHHYGNKTITTVAGECDVESTFKHNHEHMQKRWQTRLRGRKPFAHKE